MDRTEAERSILRRGWLAEQEPALRSAILGRARSVDFTPGAAIFHAGDEGGGIYGVISGGIGVYLPATNGELTLTHVARCGLWFGYGPLVRGQRRSLSFSALEPTRLLHVPLPALKEIMQRSAAHQSAVLSICEYGMDTAIEALGTLLIRSPSRRLAATLLRAAPNAADIPLGQATSFALTQAQLGEMACISRQVVNRTLKRMEAKGWLTSTYGRIEFLNREALNAHATRGR